MRLGVYVGSFNPVHSGHIHVVNHLIKKDYVDKVIMLATPNYWDKQDLAPVEKRIEMLKIFKSDKIIIDDKNNNYEYTYEVLRALKKDYPKDELYLIIGADNLEKFNLWKNIDEILNNKVFVLKRKNYDIKKHLEKFNSPNIIEVKNFTPLEISSTSIRDILPYIDEKVFHYIKKNSLYNSELYKNEKEFLKEYDEAMYEKLSMTSDILLISISTENAKDYRKNEEKKMSILLSKRNSYPFNGRWCLPGGFIDPKNETLEECAKRVLKTETNLDNIYLEQLYTFDSLDRDPRMRVISTSFLALVDKNKLTNMNNIHAKWFDVKSIVEKDNIVKILLENEETITLTIKKDLISKTSNVTKFTGINNNKIAFDHDRVILAGIERIKNKLTYTDIAFNLMPKYFTLKELQQVYEIILGKKLLDPAFRRMIKDKVVKTSKMEQGTGHRPSNLYKYKGDK